MNKLNNDHRSQILQLLCEGMSMRAVARCTGKSKNTNSKLLVDAGKVCSAYQMSIFATLQRRSLRATPTSMKVSTSYVERQEPNHTDAHAPFHPPDKWLFKEGRKS